MASWGCLARDSNTEGLQRDDERRATRDNTRAAIAEFYLFRGAGQKGTRSLPSLSSASHAHASSTSSTNSTAIHGVH